MSPKLPVTTPRKPIRALKRGGFIVDHQTGSHVSLSHPELPERFAVVPYHNRDLSKDTLKSILRQAGLTVEELNELL